MIRLGNSQEFWKWQIEQSINLGTQFHESWWELFFFWKSVSKISQFFLNGIAWYHHRQAANEQEQPHSPLVAAGCQWDITRAMAWTSRLSTPWLLVCWPLWPRLVEPEGPPGPGPVENSQAGPGLTVTGTPGTGRPPARVVFKPS